ncbi:MAG: tetratricopeptide repeat protein [Thermoanaerobaculia bacterium]
MKRILCGAAFLAFLAPLDAAMVNPKSREPSDQKVLPPGDSLDEKIREQEKRVKASPDSADLRNDLANLLAARNSPVGARQQYEAAIKLDPKHYLAPYNLGLLCESEGKVSQAISAYEKSVDRNGQFPLSRFRLGRLYEKRGRDQTAIEQYAVALRIDPSLRDIRRNPLVADTRLLDQASLENYSRDLATLAVKADAVFVEEARFRRAPVDHPLSSEEVTEPAPAPAPTAPLPSASVSATVTVPTPSASVSATPAAPAPPASPTPTPTVRPTPAFGSAPRPVPIPPAPPASGSPAIRGALVTAPNATPPG